MVRETDVFLSSVVKNRVIRIMRAKKFVNLQCFSEVSDRVITKRTAHYPLAFPFPSGLLRLSGSCRHSS